jgi:predicted membrane protein
MYDMNLLFESKKGIVVLSIFTFLVGLFIGGFTRLKIFEDLRFKFLLFFFIMYSSSVSLNIAIILSLLLLVAYQTILKVSMSENFGVINESEYLENPLMKSSELEPMNDKNFILITPKEMSNKMIKEGKEIMNLIQEMRENGFVDEREQNIIYELENKANNLIQSGMNTLDNNQYSGITLKT